jgi:hypothetical protein
MSNSSNHPEFMFPFLWLPSDELTFVPVIIDCMMQQRLKATVDVYRTLGGGWQ